MRPTTCVQPSLRDGRTLGRRSYQRWLPSSRPHSAQQTEMHVWPAPMPIVTRKEFVSEAKVLAA